MLAKRKLCRDLRASGSLVISLGSYQINVSALSESRLEQVCCFAVPPRRLLVRHLPTSGGTRYTRSARMAAGVLRSGRGVAVCGSAEQRRANVPQTV